MYEVSRLSRPKSAMNHGAPAATTVRSGCSGSNNRSAARSSVERSSRSSKSRSFDATVAMVGDAAPDIPVEEDNELGVGQARARRVAQHELGAERIDCSGAERLRPLIVDPEPQLREEASVAVEEPVREAGHHVAR